jgi:phosphatidylinositol glycan class B
MFWGCFVGLGLRNCLVTPLRDETATLDSGGSRSERAPVWRSYTACLWLVIVAASTLRVWLAVTDHSIYWPDEIYQSLEQAHRVAFGNGIVPWEFRDGARSWILPGTIAGLWKLASALGVSSSLALVGLARMLMVLASATSMWLSARVAERLSGVRAGIVAAVLLAVLPASVVFGYRTLSETVSAPLVVLGLYFLLERTPRAASLSGFCITLATLVRFQNGLFALGFVLWLLLEQRRKDAYSFVRAALGCAIAGGILDWVTWGRPFNSVLAYMEFNLLDGGASIFGVEPFWYYIESLWGSTGPSLIAFAAVGLLGATRQPVLGTIAFAYLLVHSLIPHKELRFIVPLFPLCAVLIGLGADRVYGHSRSRHTLWWLSLTASACAVTFGLTQLTYGRMGQYLDTPRAARRIWNTDEDANLLLANAGQQPELCGIAALGLRAAFTGGYTYLHRSVPLVYGSQLCTAEPAVNFVLLPRSRAPALLPAGYSVVAERGELGLFRRHGACAPLPSTYDHLLEGAYNMGLQRSLATQAENGGIQFDLLKTSGAFISGWGNGEIIDCAPGRWAIGKRSVIEFEAQRTGMTFALAAQMRTFEGQLGQQLNLSLNGRSLFSGALTAGSFRLRRDVPRGLIERGANRLAFEFSRTWRPGGDDPRELAALLQSLSVVPMTDDYVIDFGTPESSDHMLAGFSSNEVGEDGSSFTWNEGPYSEVIGTLAEPRGPYLLSIVAEGISSAPSQHTRVTVNDRAAGVIDFTPNWRLQTLRLDPDFLQPGSNRVRFDYESVVTPAALNPASTDDRQLAVRFDSLRLEPLPAPSQIDLGTPESHALLLEGWSGDERDGSRSAVWSVGPSARMLLTLSGDNPAQSLQVESKGYRPALPLEVTVFVNEQVAGSFSVSADWQTHEVPLSQSSFSKLGDIVEFRFDRTARPSQHEPGSRDERELAVRFDQIRVVR